MNNTTRKPSLAASSLAALRSFAARPWPRAEGSTKRRSRTRTSGVAEAGEEEEEENWEDGGCCKRQRVTAGSVEEGEGVERETWPRIFLGEGCSGELEGLLAFSVVVVEMSSATHAASVEGDERNSMAWETP